MRSTQQREIQNRNGAFQPKWVYRDPPMGGAYLCELNYLKEGQKLTMSNPTEEPDMANPI